MPRDPRPAPSAPANGRAAVGLSIDPQLLRPVIEAVVAEVVARLDGGRAALPDKLLVSEAEAARLLSLAPHQLRDLRLRGEISYVRGVGNRVFYRRDDLLGYIAGRRVDAG
jgi:hypothetical protein